MRSDEVAIADAVAALRTRLESWGIDDAAEKAVTYVNDVLRNGWRPNRALPTGPPPRPRPADRDTVAKHIAAIRQQLRPTPARTRDADETKETDRG